MKLSRPKLLFASAVIAAAPTGSPATAQSTAKNDIWLACYSVFWTPDHRYLNKLELPIVKIDKGAFWPDRGSDRLAESLERELVKRLGASEVNDAGCPSSNFESGLRNERKGEGKAIEWPFDPKKELMRFVDADFPGRAKGSEPSLIAEVPTRVEAKSATPKSQVTQPKYVEVPGPNGVMRLSPEVAARNQAAADEYKRKMQEHSEAVARAEAANQAKAQKLAQDVANAAAEKREYERKLAEHAAIVAAQKAATAMQDEGVTASGGLEQTVKITSTYRATREEAYKMLMSLSTSPITNVQCVEITFYKPAKWACSGTYQQKMTRSSTSKQ